MPLLHVAVTGNPDPARCVTIASTLTELTSTHLGKDPALTAITIRPVAHDHWFIGAKALSGQGGDSFSLHISVTAGTNTKPQIAAYSEAVFSAMSETLGGVCEESYVVVDEVPAGTWGYGGKTQEYRFIAAGINR